MKAARHNMRERGGKKLDKENLGELWNIYYNNRSIEIQTKKVLPGSKV